MVERETTELVRQYMDAYDEWWLDRYTCSACEESFKLPTYHDPPKYCPFCGRKHKSKGED